MDEKINTHIIVIRSITLKTYSAQQINYIIVCSCRVRLAIGADFNINDFIIIVTQIINDNNQFVCWEHRAEHLEEREKNGSKNVWRMCKMQMKALTIQPIQCETFINNTDNLNNNNYRVRWAERCTLCVCVRAIWATPTIYSIALAPHFKRTQIAMASNELGVNVCVCFFSTAVFTAISHMHISNRFTFNSSN